MEHHLVWLKLHLEWPSNTKGIRLVEKVLHQQFSTISVEYFLEAPTPQMWVKLKDGKQVCAVVLAHVRWRCCGG